MKVITYRITLLQPTLVTRLEGDPNSDVAFDYLPGSALRGAIIGNYLRLNRLTSAGLDASDAAVRRLFFDGATRYLNGYLVDRRGQRALPAPRSWQRRKGEVNWIFDFAVEQPEDLDIQWQSIDSPFCSLTEQGVAFLHPNRHISVHTMRTRRFGRAMPRDKIGQDEQPGAVYRYDALEAGQVFEAAVICDYDADAEVVLPFLDGPVDLGGARTVDYGRAEVHDARVAAGWREVSGPPQIDLDGKLVMTLLSDALLRDGSGQFAVSPDIVDHILGEQLGVRARLRRLKAFLHGQPVGGFNRKWGLPLPQALAAGMGSVFEYDASQLGALDPAAMRNKLAELETQGIGERRAEGFGRLAFNWHTEPELNVDTVRSDSRQPPVQLPPGSESEALARRMAQRRLRQRLDQQLVKVASNFTVSNPPSKAQLSRLRSILHDELMKDSPGPERLSQYMELVKVRRTARAQFDRGRVGREPLLDWLERACQQTSETEWKASLELQDKDLPGVGGVRAETGDGLRKEYTLRLIDAVLARAAKQAQKGAD